MEIKDTFRYTSTDIARYIIALANERRVMVNMTKVQKLLYITYGVFLRIYHERLLNEYPQAWPYGPVFPTTRNKLLKDDFQQITRNDITATDRTAIEQDAELNRVVDFVFSHFGTWNAGQLSEWSHSDGSPWQRTTDTDDFKWGDVIPDEYILEYFTKIITINDPQ
ncbi:MAG: DUF4065 domain-containing protein [Prevotellaceae bacterium]|nr:DUF4065 domain-containing protein [Prevotella sp.]MDD7272844.1 DUF4065 domain-containing protein [Prevotellaceae bacterium]